MSSLINLQDVSKIYETGTGQYSALNRVSLQIDRGELVAIIGSSGSGKSTLMNIIGCLDRCTTGSYHFADKNISQFSNEALAEMRNQQVGFVFQSFFLLPRLSALQNVMLPLFYRGVAKPHAEERAHYWLDKMGMDRYSHHKPNQLSGGQQQRVAIARALIGDPGVILADEPTGSLDSVTGQDVMQILLELNQTEKRTIVVVTHDQNVSQLCSRVIQIKDGVVL